MRCCIALFSFLMVQQAVAADWWWKAYTPQYNQGTQLTDPNQSNQAVHVLQNPASGCAQGASSGCYNLNQNLSTQPPVVLVGKPRAGDVRELAGGTAYSLMLTKDGTVYAAGDNTYGQLGTGDNATMLGAWSRVTQGMQHIVACSYFSLAIATDGNVWATGDNTWGEQGDGTGNASVNAWHVALKKASNGQVSTMDHALHLACGERHALAIRTDGTLWAIGDGSYGQTGRGTTPRYWQQVPVTFVPTTIAAGAFHSLAIDDSQQLWVTGDDQFGEIGANGAAVSAFAQIPLPAPVVAIAAGYRHSLALRVDGGLEVTGDNSAGQLGTTDYTSYRNWSGRLGNANITSIAARDNQSFAMMNGQLNVTGDNSYGQLGLAGTVVNTPSWQNTGIPATLVAPGVTHTLVINTATREVWATGDNGAGQLGALNPSATPSPPWVKTAN